MFSHSCPDLSNPTDTAQQVPLFIGFPSKNAGVSAISSIRVFPTGIIIAIHGSRDSALAGMFFTAEPPETRII